MRKTQYFKLLKPEMSDFANIEDTLNPSMDIIDTKLKELEDNKVSAKDGKIGDIQLAAAWADQAAITDIGQIESKRKIKDVLSAMVAGLKLIINTFSKTTEVWMRVEGFTKTAPYTLKIDIPEMKSTYTPIISHLLKDGVTDAEAIKGAWKSYDCIDRVDTFDGYIIVSCFVKRPKQDVLLGVKGR